MVSDVGSQWWPAAVNNVIGNGSWLQVMMDDGGEWLTRSIEKELIGVK